MELEQSAGFSIRMWASIGYLTLCFAYLFNVMCKYGRIHGNLNVLRVFTMPIRKEFWLFVLSGVSHALGGIFLVLSFDFANRADVNHGIIVSFAVIASIFMFIYSYYL